MALFGNDMFGHHMVSHNQNQGFGKGNSGATFGKSAKDNQDPNAGHIGNHSIFGRQKSLLNDMTSSKHDKGKPYVFSSYSYPYDFHHEGMASMFEKPMEKAKKRPTLEKQQSLSIGDRPEFRRAPSFASNPKLMRSKTINPTDTKPSRPPKLSRSLSIADDQMVPVNMDLRIPDFKQRRNSEKAARKLSLSDASEKPKKKSWPDIVKRITRRKKSPSKERTRKSTASTDDSARESMGSTSSVGTFDSPKSSTDLPSEEIPRCNTIDSKLSRGSVKSRSSNSSDYDREQEKLILSLLSNDFSQEEVFEDRVPSKESDSQDHGPNTSINDNHPYVTSPFDPFQPIEDDMDDDEQHKNYSESPTLVLRRIKHLHPHDAENASVISDRMTPRSYFSDTSEPSSITKTRDTEPKTKARDQDKKNGTVVMYTDPSDSETSGAFFDFPQGKPAKPIVLSNRPRRTSDKKKKVPELAEERPSKPSTPQRTSVQDILKNFQNLKTTPETGVNEKKATKEVLKPEPIHKPYVAPKVFTISPPQSYRPFTSIYSKPVSPGYTKKEPNPDNQVVVQHVQPYTAISPLERVSPKYANPLKVEPEGKDANGNDNLTADSSESGYGTSHIPNSPKCYDNMKVLNFVNSLPNHSDMEEQSSEISRDEIVMNGSETESIEDDDSELYEPQSDLSNVKCTSGSDTDIASINSDISESQLEVTKLLDSPTDVCERVTSEMSRRSNQSTPSIIYRKMSDPNVKKPLPAGEPLFTYNIAPTDDHPYKKNEKDIIDSNRMKRDPSETELLRVFESDKKPEPLTETEVPLEADVQVVVSRPQSMAPMTESKLYRGPEPSDHSLPKSRPISYSSSRQYSTIQESTLTQCIDAVLHLLNCLLVICSTGVIVAGIWLLMKDFNVNHVTIILGNNLLQVIVYVSIGGAVVAILAALCLCCGVKKDKYGLSFFAIVLIIVIIAFSSAAILSAIFADKLQGIEFRVNFKERLIAKYGNITEVDRENEHFTASWDSMQKLFECCGAEGDVSDMASWAVFKKFSIWYRKQPFKAHIYVPESCCKKNMDLEVCQGSNHHLLGPPVYGPPMDDIYSQDNPNLNTTGCYDFFASYLARLTTIVAIVMGGLAGLYFLSVMLTWVFCFKKNQDYEDYLYGSFCEDQADYHYNSEHEMETKLTSEHAPSKLDTSNNARDNSLNKPNPDYVVNQSEYIGIHSTNNNVLREPEQFNCMQSPPIEETSFMRKPVETVHTKLNKSPLEAQIIPHDNTQQASKPVEYKIIDNRNEEEDSDGSESETDSENDYESENTTFRRNLWLSSESGRAVNLLSIAIEEEDSNFEDSDVEESKVQSAGTYRHC